MMCKVYAVYDNVVRKVSDAVLVCRLGARDTDGDLS